MDTLPEPLRPKFGSKLESSVNIGGLEINSDSLTRISEITGENAVGRLQEAIKKPLLVAENKSGGQVVFVDLSGKTGLKNGSQKGKLNLAETGKIAALRISSNSGKSVISGVTFKPQILSLEGFITDNAKSFVPTYFDNGINSLLSNSLKLDIENALKAKKTIESQTEERQGFEEGIIGDEGNDNNVENFLKTKVNLNFIQNVKSAFASDIKATTLTKDITVYRYHGGITNKKSYWYTPKLTSNPAADLALPPGNTYKYVDTYIIPKGTTVLEGTVAPNFGQQGGGYQIYVPDPSVVIPK